MCYNCKLSSDDLDEMTYGNLIDYVNAYIEMRDPTPSVKDADQDDIERFFG